MSTASLPDLIAAPADDLLVLTASLVAVPSVSRQEGELADHVERRLAERASRLALTRVGNTVIARTELGRERRIVLGGHLDTVPANGNEVPRLDGDVLHGLGSADMKGGLAVLLEPTGDHIEAGCQGTLHLRAHFEGERAHSARPWKGRNAIYAAADVLERLAAHEAETVVVDGLPYRESLQAVRIEGGVANNVVPDECTIVVNRRFAPKYSVDEARAQVEKLLEGADRVEVINASPAAPPNLGHPLAAEFVEVLGLDVEPKLGWTDVARFASRDIPAVNFGPGDPDVAHTADERVTRASVEQCYAAFARFLGLAA